MDYVIYALIACNILVFAASLIAIRRVGKVLRSTHDLDWQAVANITGDISSVKKTIQTLNNRLNGMNKATIDEEDIVKQMMQAVKPELRQVGG
jgi:alkylated DNA nucleotide flippase Atl1